MPRKSCLEEAATVLHATEYMLDVATDLRLEPVEFFLQVVQRMVPRALFVNVVFHAELRQLRIRFGAFVSTVREQIFAGQSNLAMAANRGPRHR